TTTEVTVSGTHDFAGAYKVLFEGEGLTAEIVPPAAPVKAAGAKPADAKAEKTKPSADSVTLKVTAAPDAPVGVRELRVATPLGDKIHDLQEHVDPLLVLRDSSGREIARADDTYGADPLLIHRFERDGDYLIEIRDVRYHGNPSWVYRLTLTRRPWVTALLPMVARPGETATLQLVGANLGAAPT